MSPFYQNASSLEMGKNDNSDQNTASPVNKDQDLTLIACYLTRSLSKRTNHKWITWNLKMLLIVFPTNKCLKNRTKTQWEQVLGGEIEILDANCFALFCNYCWAIWCQDIPGLLDCPAPQTPQQQHRQKRLICYFVANSRFVATYAII